MWRGSPSSRSTRPKKRSSAPSPSPLARSSGRSRSAEPGVAGTDVGERLGDRVHLSRRHAEGGADVADGVADPVGVHHRDGDAPLAAEAVEDRAVDLLAPGGLHVDVDVGQRGTQRRQEPLHQQAVADRVDPGDAEQVVDQAAGARPARGTTDAHLADQVGDVGDGQEVGRVAQGPDGLELVVEPLPDPHHRAGAVAPADRRLAAGAQQRRRPCGVGPRRRARAPGSAPRRCRGRCAGRARTGRRPPACGRATASPPARCRPARRGGRSRSATSCICLPVLRNPSALPRVPSGPTSRSPAEPERHQSPGRVEDVDRRRVEPVGVAHRVGQHRREAGAPGDAGHPRGVGRRARPPGAPAAAEPVGHQLDDQVGARHHLQPRREHRRAEVVAAPGGDRAQLGGRPEQHEHVTARQVGGQQVERSRRVARAPRTGGPRTPSGTAPPSPPCRMARNVTRALPPCCCDGSRDTPPRAGVRRRGGRPPAATAAPPVAASVSGRPRGRPRAPAGCRPGGLRRRTSPRRRCRHDR